MAEGTVTIKGRAELGQLNRAVDKLDARVKKVDRSATSMRTSLRSAGTALVGLGAAVGVTGAGLTKLIDDTLQARLEMNNLANTAGITAPTFGALAQAADLAGVSSKKLVGGLQTLTDQAFKASQENETAKKKFEALGVSVTDAGKELRSTEDIFKDVLTALGEIPNETDRAARAQELLGKSAGSLRAALGELSIEGFEAAEEKARAFTRGLSEEGIAAAASYEAALTKLAAVQRSVGDSISDFAGPVLNALVNGLTYASVFLADVFDGAMERVGQRALLLVEAVKVLGDAVGKALTGDFEGAAKAVREGDEAIRQLREGMGLALNPLEDFGDVISNAKDKASEAVTALDQVHDATRDLGTAARSASGDLGTLTESIEAASEASIKFKDSADLIVIHPDEADEQLQIIDNYVSATDRYLQKLREVQDQGSIVTPQELADVEAYASGFTSVSSVIGDLAGAYVDAALQSDNLTDAQKKAALTAFRVQKAMALATAVVNIALGVTQALASAPPPLNFINAGLVTAAGAVSLVEIASQKPPSFATGGIMPSTGGPAILHPGEGVLSAGAVDSMGGASALDGLNSRTALAGGGAVVVQWKHLRQSFAYEARDGANRPGPLRNIRRDGRRAGQMRRAVRADYGSL